MNRSLLTPRWLLLHLLFIAAAVATIFLARWQWDTAHEAGGTFQNLGYAFQWPLFGGFTVFMWYRVAIKDRQQSAADQAKAKDQVGAEDQVEVKDREPVLVAGPKQPLADEPRVRRRPLVPPSAQPVTAEEDPELAAYNQFLSRLGRSQQR